MTSRLTGVLYARFILKTVIAMIGTKQNQGTEAQYVDLVGDWCTAVKRHEDRVVFNGIVFHF